MGHVYSDHEHHAEVRRAEAQPRLRRPGGATSKIRTTAIKQDDGTYLLLSI
jgi:hypothetical protein